MIEAERVKMAIWRRLAGDSALTALLPSGANSIFHSVASLNAALPNVILDIPASTDVNSLDGTRIWANTLASVIVRGRGSGAALLPIADRIDALLQGYTVTLDGVLVVQLRRETGGPLPTEVDSGVLYPAYFQQYRTEAHQYAAA